MRSELWERLRRERNWSAILDELEQQAMASPDDRSRARALFELGPYAEEWIPWRERALDLYQKAWKTSREFGEPLLRARELYRELGRWDMVGKVGELELATQQSQGEFDADLAALVGEALLDGGHAAKAQTLLQQAIESNPNSFRARDALAALEYDRNEWIDQIEKLQKDAEKVDSATAARMLLRSARIYRAEMGEDETYEAILHKTLSFEPQNEPANFLLETLWARQEKWTELAQHHTVRAYAEADDRVRAELYRGFALIWTQRFKDKARAAQFWSAAIRSMPENPDSALKSLIAAFVIFEELANTLGVAEILTLADATLATPTEPEQTFFVARMAGTLAWKQTGDLARAAGYFAQVRAVAPDAPELAEFDRLFQTSAKAAPQNEVSANPGSGPSTSNVPADKPAVSAKSSNGKKSEGKKPEASIVPEAPSAPSPAVSQVRPPPERVEPSKPEAKPEPKAEVKPETKAKPPAVAAKTISEPMPANLEAAVDVARRAESESPERAIDTWRRVVIEHPTERNVRREYARVLRSAARWPALVEALKEEEQKSSSGPGEQTETLRDLVDAYRQLKNEAMAVSTLGQIAKINPDDTSVLDELVAQYETMKKWPDMVATLQKKAPLVQDDAERVALYLRIAGLYTEKFSNQAEAIKAYEKVLETDPDNEQAIRPLREVYEKRRDWEKLLALREREIDRTYDLSVKRQLVYDVAQIAHTKVKKAELCTIWWAKLLELDPVNEEALTELDKLYERAKQWDKLAEISEIRVEHASDAKKRVDALQKLGLIYGEKLEDRTKATSAWRRLLEVEPENRRAQDSLKRLFVADRDWAALEAFYRDQNKLDEFLRVLERQVEEPTETDKLALALRIAGFYRDELAKPDRAMRAYEKALSLEADNLAAAEALIPLYEQSRDPKKLAGVLEIQLAKTEDEGDRLARTIRLAEFSEEKLREKPAAFSWWLKAFELAPQDPAIRAQVERLAGETGGHQEVALAYEHAYSRFPDPLSALPVMLVVAQLQEKMLAQPEKALATNQEILRLDETNDAALDALERLYSVKGDSAELLAVFHKKLERSLDPQERAQIQVKIGRIYEDDLHQDSKAIELYRAILDEHGDELSALAALDRLYQRTGSWNELADTLRREMALVDSSTQLPEHVALLYRLGQLQEKELSNVREAIEIYSNIMQLAPGHEAARASLEKHLDGEHKVHVAAILEPIYEELGMWRELVSALELSLLETKDQTARVATFMRMGEIHSRRIGDADSAFEAYSRAFSEAPGVGGAKAELEELCSLVDQGWPKLIALFEQALSGHSLDGALTFELASKVARAYEEHMGNRDKAVEYYQMALSVEPDDTATLDALERIFTQGEKYNDLLQVFRRKADLASEPDLRMSLLFRIASIHEEMLADGQSAIETYNEILMLDADSVHALSALDRLYTEKAQWRDLSDILMRRLTMTNQDDERVDFLVRLADLQEEKLGEKALAVDTYRQVLDLSPGHPVAVARLEKHATDPQFELAIAQILDPVYRSTGDWAKQIGVYEVMARHALDPERKIELFHAIAELQELGGEQTASAFTTYARAFREDPRHDTTQGQLLRLAKTTGNWNELTELYEQVAGEQTDDELKIQLFGRLAQIYEIELRDDNNAVSAHERVLVVVPNHTDAISAIIAIHERTGNYAALVQTLVRKSEMLSDAAQRKELLFRAAQIQEEVLDNHDGAIALYNSILDLDGQDMPAIDALERLFIRLERWSDLKDIYARKADLAEDPEDKKRMLYVLGQVYDRELGDVGKAIETYQSIVDIDPNELPAIQALDRLFGQAERWYDLLAVLERQVELAGTTTEAVALKYRVGRLWQDRLGDVARAIETYRDALTLDYSHLETLSALDGLLHREEGEPMLAAAVLEPIYEASGQFDRLVDVLEVMVKHTTDPLERVGLLHRIANLGETRMGEAERAFKAYARALRDDNTNEQTLGHLERLANVTGGWREVATLYASEAEKSLDVPQQVNLWQRLAAIYELELNEPDHAITTYRRVLDVEFDNRQAIYSLDRLYSQAEKWHELTEILKKEIQIAESDEQVLDLQFRLAQTLQHSLGDVGGSIEAYREILQTQPSHGPTLGALEMLFLDGQKESEIAAVLEPIYVTEGAFDKLHGIYEVQLQKLSDPSERQSFMHRLAELAEEKLLDPMRALGWWGNALLEDPTSTRNVDEVERLGQATGSWADVVAFYGQVLERHESSDVRKDILLRMARVYEVELGDAVNAVEALLRVLEIDAKQPDALASLDRLYSAAGMYDELVEILRRRCEVTLDSEELAMLQLRRGQILAEALGDLDGAAASYDQVLEQDSRNRTALDAQEAIFFQQEKWEQLFSVYERLVDTAVDENEIAEFYARMAKLCSDALSEDDRAVDFWNRALDVRPENQRNLGELAALLQRKGRYSELVEVLERQISFADDGAVKLALYKQQGQTWSRQLGDERSALDAWLRAYEIDPNDLETLNALAEIYRSTQSWEELSQSLRRIIEVGQELGGVTEDQLVSLYGQLGQLEGDVLGRVDESVDAWRRVLALKAGDEQALAALEQLFTREARWEECIEVLEHRAQVSTALQAQIDTLLEAGAIWEEKVGDLDKAAEVYSRIRAVQPSHARVSARLEEIYRSQYKWEQLNEILLERVEHTDDKDIRIDLFQAVAKNFEEELNDQESAFVVLQAAFREDYAQESTAKELERLATAAGKWRDLLEEYTLMVQQLETEDRSKACDLWVKIGRWYGDHLQHVDYAIHSIQQAIRLDPNHGGALTALAGLQRKRGSWHELVDTLTHHAAVEPSPEHKVDLYLSLADLFENQLRDPMQAIASYQSVLTYDESNQAALGSLDRLYRTHEMWEQLVDISSRRAALSSDVDEVVRLKLTMGSLWENQLGDTGQAILAYQGALETDPSCLPAMRALEGLYERTGQSEKYLDILESQLDASREDNEQVALYARMAAAWEERFGKLDRAEECLEKIVTLDASYLQGYEELERLYTKEGKWESLVDTYRRHANVVPDAATKMDIYCAMGHVYEHQLKDFDRSIEAYNDVLSFDSGEPRALDALGRLYEAISEWDKAIDVMNELIQTTDDVAKRVDLHHRMGRVQFQHLGNAEGAEQNFRAGLTMDPSHVPTMESLVELYAGRGDWLKAAQLMAQAEQYTPNVLDKIRLLQETANVYLYRLGQKPTAKQYYAAVIDLDPEYVPAGEPLSELYFENNEFEALSPVLDMLVRKSANAGKSPAELVNLYYRTAKTAVELGDYQKAQQFYKGAYDIDATNLKVLMGRADLLYHLKDWDGAGKIYQTILVQHRDSQQEGDVVRTYNRLGMVRLQLGETKKALNMFEKAIEIDPSHRETLESMIGIHERANEWEAVTVAKRRLMAAAEIDEQVALLDEIAEIYSQKFNPPEVNRAIAALNEALQIKPEEHKLLHKLLELYYQASQWKKVVEISLRFVDLEKDPVRKGSYYRTAAEICRDQLKALDEAVDYYNLALDNFFHDGGASLTPQTLPRAFKAFADIDKILTTKRDWKAQERAYRGMIKRLRPGDPALIQLWHALGEIYRSRLKQYQSAVAAFEVAAQLEPQNKERREILAELYLLAGPDHLDKAVEQHSELLKAEPFRYESYHALRRIYMDAHQYDKTWCVCAALSFLKKAEPDEQQFFEQYKPKNFVKAKQRMTDDMWRALMHPDESPYVSAIFGAIWQGVALMMAQPFKVYEKEFGLKKKDKIVFETDELKFSKIFYYCAQVLGAALPDAYLKPDQPGQASVANIEEKGVLAASLVVRADLLGSRPEREVAFHSAKWLSSLRPDHYLRLILPSNTELKRALLTAITLVNPRFPVPPDTKPLVAQYLPELQKRMPPQMLEPLAVVVNRFIQAAPEVNLAKWSQGVELGTHRIGFVISGDLEVAARMVSMEPQVVGGLQVKDKVKELVLFAISENYFKIRSHLGITIG